MRRLLLRSLLAPWVAAKWTLFVSRLHRELGASAPSKAALAKPLRRYVHFSLGPRGRLELLLGHYAFMSRRFSRDLQFRLCDGQTLEIAALQGRKEAQFRLELGSSAFASGYREGEIVLYLKRVCDGALLSQLALLFVGGRNDLTLVIGGLQGPRPGHKREVIDATRLMHGLRPKDATLLAARALADALGGVAWAVADAGHVFHRKQGRAKLSDYDAYWRERGARAAGRDQFVFDPLPALGDQGLGREAMKRAIVSGVRAFVEANRRTPGEECAPTCSARGAFAPARSNLAPAAALLQNEPG
jgi:uncharacterized protein VirK/YbjX